MERKIKEDEKIKNVLVKIKKDKKNNSTEIFRYLLHVSNIIYLSNFMDYISKKRPLCYYYFIYANHRY